MIRATHGELQMLRAGRAQKLQVPAVPNPPAPKPLCPLKLGNRYTILAAAVWQDGVLVEKRQKITATAFTADLAADGEHYDVTFLARVDV